MHAAIDLEAVLISSDSQVLNMISQSLAKSDIKPVLFKNGDSAMDYICKRKIDALIVDSQVEGAVSVLNNIRKSPSNFRAATFAITTGEDEETSRLAHFSLDKPMPQAKFERALRVAYGFILRERYRYYRHAIELPVTLSMTQERVMQATSVNISESGMSVRSQAPLQKREVLQVKFAAPGSSNPIQTAAEVVWADAKGQAGLRFISMKAADQKVLSAWLAQEFHSV